jgi:hypothetical protein
LGLGLTGGVFFLMSYRPVDVVFVLGAVVCAVVGPLLLILLPLGLTAVANVKLVLTPIELCLVNESGGQSRSIPRVEISGVWRVTLPAGITVSDVPALPKKVVLIAGLGRSRPILLHGEWRPSDLENLWQQLGYSPVDAGKMRQAELDERFQGGQSRCPRWRRGLEFGFACTWPVLLRC